MAATKNKKKAKSTKRVATKRAAPKTRRVAPKRTAPPKSKLPRITYSNLALTEADHSTYEAAVGHAREALGDHYQNFINGKPVGASDGQEQMHSSPADTRLIVSYFPRATRDDTKEAIRSARAVAKEWGNTPWAERVRIMRRAADLMYERAWEITAMLAFEVGKARAEGIAEVYEGAELIRYYCDQMELNRGYTHHLESPGKGQTTESVLRPYGVFAVIAPWNFPVALATGMSSASLIAGNAAVIKPASESPVSAYMLYKCIADAGVPDGVYNLVVGPSSSVGEELRVNPGVDGLVFTGSYDVGMYLFHNFSTAYPKPVITEMGGKNPVIITANADLELAAEGVMKAAFGFSGQKCSAASRVYVDRSVKGEFIERLGDVTNQRVTVGFPTERAVFMGPVMNQKAVDTWQAAVDDTVRDGGRVVHGGNRIMDDDLKYGYYVQPTIVDNLPASHRLFKEELFVPFISVAEVDSLEEALREANDVQFGLTAGIYSEDEKEVDYFFDNVEAGVLYSNRRAGATTGAWPGTNTFGGWKGSGSSGKNAFGPHYLQLFMREQSRWVVEE